MSNSLYAQHVIPSGLVVVTPPASEPVTVAEAKLWIRQESDFTADDGLIAELIQTARVFAEAHQRRTLILTSWAYSLDCFPSGGWNWTQPGAAIFLPMPRLVSVSSVAYVDQTGATQTLSNTRYTVDTRSQPGRVAPIFAQPWPVVRPQAAAVVVTYTAGYANAAAVPAPTKTAIKQLVAHWYRNREAVGNAGDEVALAAKRLLDADAVGGLY